jgi:hypothetical protein
MSKLRSEFHDCDVVCEAMDGSPVEDAPQPPSKVQMECVFKGKRRVPVAMYWVVDGVRVAYRGRNEFGPTWIPMQPNVTCVEDCFTDSALQ